MRTRRVPRTVLAASVATVTALVVTSCGGSGSDSGSGGGKKLNIYAWAGEIPESVVKKFEAETGIKVTLDTFDSNETMTAKLSSGSAGYDLVEPSQYTVQQLIGQKLIQPLDHARIKGMDNLAEKFRDPSYDKGNKYSVPWIWGTTGFAYNDKCVDSATSWKTLFDKKYQGKVYMLDNMLAAYIAGLQVTGARATSTDEGEIKAATEALEDQKDILAGYNSTNYPQLLSTGQACAAQAWSGTAMAKVVAANENVHYVIPEEGGSIWTDGLSIPKGAKNTDAAYEFINFTLRPEIAAMATDDGGSASTNAKAREFIKDKKALDNPAVYASDEAIKNADFLLDPGTAMKHFQQGWTKVKAS
ncbi:ABC transporter substrate-binding protein [Streptomyces uncialis]|uniref:Spermidine/putrecine ABC transporter substrate-binding protein n=1 Tax=Streptomyces uncialis TaxID=1048205 RepID=A0A1Q4VB32_9ACTN|nr:spermidine/putrescine ABC transporter substrate-binding protein [Streptomyces uncialis]OKH94939.1 spermidine/putrecine ABC transporter substrate-binding protein [Streptomyces uncialis]WTE14369.1 spermidine/putrescine ABC transporter substrate-binding protein [Streptomyces uncialis]